MDSDLSDKRVLVTGSSRGIGRYIANKFYSHGCKVVLNGLSEVSLNKAVADFSSPNVSGLAADVSDPSQASELIRFCIKKYKQLDILVCNAGSGTSAPPGSETYTDWLRSFHQNFFSATNCIEEAKVHLGHAQGKVICVSSICGHEFIPGAPTTYSVAKSALNSYVKHASMSLSKSGITINAIQPGNILFPGSTWQSKLIDNPQMVNKMLKDNVPLSNFGRPEQIADLVFWLCSYNGSFCTGSIFTLDGGQTRSL
ncbi:SDR family NAD(P)-dependent oxidoreductase [Synechococcus sp. UW179B]|uniref:SDR family NAD(P)-dependent oxidoreductase n=1 Tax=Synechococcus sp. UW179B TaxID=2575516 RepID=UPI000E0FD05F|nr:SDR family oxidoreductase [Synechococcus sp. UW179B]